jgi:hypothetical protein
MSTLVFSVIEDGSSVTINLEAFNLSRDSIIERLEEIVPVLEAILSADSVRMTLTSATWRRLQVAITTQDLLYQGKLYEALAAARLLSDLQLEKENIGDHGFPEFRTSV